MGKFTKIIRSISIFWAIIFATGTAWGAYSDWCFKLDIDLYPDDTIYYYTTSDNTVKFYDNQFCNYNFPTQLELTSFGIPSKDHAMFDGLYNTNGKKCFMYNSTKKIFQRPIPVDNGCYGAQKLHARYTCIDGYSGTVTKDQTCQRHCYNFTFYITDFSINDKFKELALSMYKTSDGKYMWTDGHGCTSHELGETPEFPMTEINGTRLLGFYADEPNYEYNKCIELDPATNKLQTLTFNAVCMPTGGAYDSPAKELFDAYECPTGDIVTLGETCPRCVKLTLHQYNGTPNKEVYHKTGTLNLYSDSGCQTELDSAPFGGKQGMIFQGYYNQPTNGTQCINKQGQMTWACEYNTLEQTNLYAYYNNVYCAPGYFLPKLKTSGYECKTCSTGYYCPGGIFAALFSTDQGLSACPAGTYRGTTGGKAASDCTACPTYTSKTGTFSTSSTPASTQITACYIPAGAEFCDDIGCYTTQEDCHHN